MCMTKQRYESCHVSLTECISICLLFQGITQTKLETIMQATVCCAQLGMHVHHLDWIPLSYCARFVFNVGEQLDEE